MNEVSNINMEIKREKKAWYKRINSELLLVVSCLCLFGFYLLSFLSEYFHNAKVVEIYTILTLVITTLICGICLVGLCINRNRKSFAVFFVSIILAAHFVFLIIYSNGMAAF